MTKWIAGTVATITVGTAGLFAADQAQNPYEDKGTHHELDIKADIEQGERVEIAKDRATMTLKGWNDEYAITITPQIPGSTNSFNENVNRPLLSKRMEYRSGNVTAFIEPKNDTDFDIDFTLQSKPDTNVFTYKIEGAEAFDFFYQPELTPQEIADGTFRPENVIGSYAVYHKTRAHHREGHTNYATGKAFHIYRPKAIDADGTEVWAELSYINGALSVTVPQKFLNQATYPVHVDPTIGYTTMGATQSTIAQTTQLSRRHGNDYTLSQSGTLTSIHIATKATSADETADTMVFINDKDSGGSGTHDEIARIERTNLSHTVTAAWHTFTGASEALTADTYILNVLGDGEDLAASNINIRLDATSITHYDENVNAAGSYLTMQEDPWTETAAAANNTLSIYVTYATTDTGTFTDNFTTTGYTTWTVPTGVTSIDIACWGAGGGGGDGSGSGGGGGGGGAFASTTQSVSPSDVIRLFIGTGGISNATAANGTNGGTSTASTTAPATIVSAAPGWGGKGSTSADGPGGLGGAVASSTGTTLFAGGNGGTGVNTSDGGGGGGGSAGPDGAGVAGSDGSGTNGGNGGAGNNTAGGAGGSGGIGGGAAATVGTSHTNGGGGGGGGANGGPGANAGTPGAGGGGGEINTAAIVAAAGQCRITYTVTAAAAAPTSDDTYFEILESMLWRRVSFLPRRLVTAL